MNFLLKLWIIRHHLSLILWFLWKTNRQNNNIRTLFRIDRVYRLHNYFLRIKSDFHKIDIRFKAEAPAFFNTNGVGSASWIPKNLKAAEFQNVPNGPQRPNLNLNVLIFNQSRHGVDVHPEFQIGSRKYFTSIPSDWDLESPTMDWRS